ncbi:MAG: DNA polymerase IV [Clostridiales bacterium]|nr:DNA polymerase IV [Clostridiales bacterium]
MKRIIFHIDQNCYFASVEMISHPEYRNVPMAVVGDQEARHGIVLAKNELAKKYGIKTAEAIWQAKAKCPDLVLAPAHHEKYEFYSMKLREMYYEYTDRVEPFGLDECWLDMSDACDSYEKAAGIADSIRQRVKDSFNLTCSVGISFNKIFAKLGSDYKKPDATTVFSDEDWKEKIWPLPADDLLFVGRSTMGRLTKINVRTIGDLARTDQEYLARYLGKAGEVLWRYANGLDDSPVAEAGHKREIKSVGNSTTTATDMTSDAAAFRTLHMLSESVASRLRKHGLKGTVIQIEIRDRDLERCEKQKILFEPTDNAGTIYQAAKALFAESWDWHKGIRSIGVRCSKVIPADMGTQMSFFTDEETRKKTSKLDKVIDDINRRYGKGVITSAAEAEKQKDEDGAAPVSEDPFHPEDRF